MTTITVAGPISTPADKNDALRSSSIRVGVACAATVRAMLGPRQTKSSRSAPEHASVLNRSLALQLLVPPFLQGDIVLGHVPVVEVHEALDLVLGEADALVEIR